MSLEKVLSAVPAHLAKIEISVRDAKNGEQVGASLSRTVSLSSMGKSWRDIVRQTTDRLIGGK